MLKRTEKMMNMLSFKIYFLRHFTPYVLILEIIYSFKINNNFYIGLISRKNLFEYYNSIMLIFSEKH